MPNKKKKYILPFLELPYACSCEKVHLTVWMYACNVIQILKQTVLNKILMKEKAT